MIKRPKFYNTEVIIIIERPKSYNTEQKYYTEVSIKIKMEEQCLIIQKLVL